VDVPGGILPAGRGHQSAARQVPGNQASMNIVVRYILAIG
jgi:hypothetical protein